LIKRKKEAKKEKRVAIWKTEGVFHIPTRQTNNNNYYLSLKTKTLHCPAKPSHLKAGITKDG
jgi:pyruvate dehydrogenase complex dehydrogenase (E1) component